MPIVGESMEEPVRATQRFTQRNFDPRSQAVSCTARAGLVAAVVMTIFPPCGLLSESTACATASAETPDLRPAACHFETTSDRSCTKNATPEADLLVHQPYCSVADSCTCGYKARADPIRRQPQHGCAPSACSQRIQKARVSINGSHTSPRCALKLNRVRAWPFSNFRCSHSCTRTI